MKSKTFIYLILGFFVATAIGYWVNHVVGVLAAFAIYPILIGILSIFYGIFDRDEGSDSIYEKRKKEE